MVWCKACGEELGDPDEVLHDPDDEYGIVEGGVSNPDTAHIKVVKGEKGARMQCQKAGQMTKLVSKEELEADKDEPPSDSGAQGKAGKERPVYDLKEDQSAKDILYQVVANPIHDLSDEQIQEVGDWADMYDGQIPPDTLEQVLKNLSGVSKQAAGLMAQKYEIKLTRWMQEQARDEGGPVIGAVANPIPSSGPPQASGRRVEANGSQSQPSPQGDQAAPRNHPESDEEYVDNDEESLDPHEIREEGRSRRVRRRQIVADEFAHEVAREAAPELAREFTKSFGTYFGLPARLIQAKIEKDPEWFFEKAESLDIDIIEDFFEPSQARKEEMARERKKNSRDREIDNAVKQMRGEPSSQEEHPEAQPSKEMPPEGHDDKWSEQRVPETTNNPADVQRNEHPMSASPPKEPEVDGEEEQSEDESFRQVMGELAE